MKNTIKVFGVIVLVAIIGFSACDNGGSDNTDIDTAALNAVILEAGIPRYEVETASSASDVPTGKKWVTQIEWNTFDGVYKTAVETKANPSSQSAVDAAKTNLQTSLAVFNAAKKDGSSAAIKLSGTITVKNKGQIVPYVVIQPHNNDYSWQENKRVHITGENSPWSIITKPFSSSTEISFIISGFDNDKYENKIFQITVEGLKKTVYNTDVDNININKDLNLITVSGTLKLDYNGQTVPSVNISMNKKNDTSVNLGAVGILNVRNNTTWSMMIPSQEVNTDVVFDIVGFDGPLVWEYDRLFAIWQKDFSINVGNQNKTGVALNLIVISGTVSVTYKGNRVPFVEVNVNTLEPWVWITNTTLKSPPANTPWSIVLPAYPSDTEICIGIQGRDENETALFWNADTIKTVKDKNVSGIAVNLGNITE